MLDPTTAREWVAAQFLEPGDYAEGVRSAARAALAAGDDTRERAFAMQATEAMKWADLGGIDASRVSGLFAAVAERNGLTAEIEGEGVAALLVEAGASVRRLADTARLAENDEPEQSADGHNGFAHGDEPPPPRGLEDYNLPAGGINAPELVPAAVLVSPPAWPKEPPPRVSWVAHNLIPRGDVSSLGGDGGSGKTMLALQLATAMARGAQDWLGTVVEPGPVVFLSGEEPEDEIRRRVARIAARQGFDCDALAGLHFWFPSDFSDCTFATPGPGGVMQATPLFRSVEASIAEKRPALVVLDNVAAVFAGNQNDRVMVRTFVNLFRGIARATGCGVLLLDHPSLSGLTTGTGRGGNMDWRNSVRAALHLKAAEDKADADRGVRVLEHVKSNYAPLAPALRLEWVDGVLAIEGTASPHQRAAQDAQADEKFLALLAQHVRLGIDVGPSEARNYAPKVFAASPDSGGYTSRAFATVMHRLLVAGRVVIEEKGPPSKRRRRLVVAGQEGTA